MKSDEADQIGLAPSAEQIASIAVTSEPAGGQGFSLNAQGHIPVVAQGGQMTLEFVIAAVDLASQGPHSGATPTVTIPGLRVGDLCIFLGSAHGAVSNRPFIKTTDVLCTTEGQCVLHVYNADTGTIDPTSAQFYFLIIHRFL